MRSITFTAIPLGTLSAGLVARSVGVRQTIVLTSILAATATIAMAVTTKGHDLEGSSPDDVASQP